MRFKVSKEARDDIREIGRYTQRKWGKDQRRHYLNDLNNKFELLAENPLLGRRCDNIRKGYFRFEYVSHVIFYRQEQDFIVITRVIHQSRDVKSLLGETGKA